MSKGRQIRELPRVLVISDAVAHTGFAQVAHGIFDHLYTKYDVHVLGINYFGDPHNYKYKIYPASTGGDLFGSNRIPSLIKNIKPHLVFMINDPWIVRDYINILVKSPVGVTEDGKEAYPHLVAYMPVDGLNLQPGFVKPLSKLNLAIGYTQFAVDQLKKSGLEADVDIIPHGYNKNEFFPVTLEKARKALNNLPQNWFIVGCVNRNQPRKRLDLALQYFSEWVKDKPENVKFYYHGGIQDLGWNILQLAEYYEIGDRLVLTSSDISAAAGVPRDFLKNIYSSFDVHISTTMGEGWGLTQLEAMACKVANIVPEWSALAEWARGGVSYVPCTATHVHTGGLNTVGGIADKQEYIKELDKMYYDETYRNSIAKAGYDLVSQPQFQWSSVASRFDTAFMNTLRGVNAHNN